MTTFSVHLPAHPATFPNQSSLMKKTLITTLAAALFAVAPGAFAHDPAEHVKEAAETKAGPDCDAMKSRDHSKRPMPAGDAKQPDAHGGH